MTKTLINSRYWPDSKIIPQSKIPKDKISTILPSNLKFLEDKLLSGNECILYEDSSDFWAVFQQLWTSTEDFQLIDVIAFDDSITKSDFVEIYHEHGAQLNDQN